MTGCPAVRPAAPARPAGRRLGSELCYNDLPGRECAGESPRFPADGRDMATNEFTLTQTQTQPGPAMLAFADADSCAAWLRALPLTNIPKHYDAVLGQLKRLSDADFAPRERARIAEVMREPVVFLHTELARRYAGKPQPAADREREAFEQAVALWQSLWAQYSACLKPLLEGDPDLQGVKAKVLQRGLWVGKQMILVHGLARHLPSPAVWQELHAYYRLAEILECGVSAVTDELMPNAIGISCYSTYCHAILLDLADPCSMSVRQIELTDRWLSMWARKVFPYTQQRETEGPVVTIDLDSPTGATLAPVGPRHPGEGTRFGYPAKLATSVRGRLKRLAGSANPAELQLGHDVSGEACTTLLVHLDACWYALPPKRGVGNETQSDLELCVGGLGAAYFRVSGRTFNSQDLLGRLSYQGTQHLATLGALTDYDRNKEEAEKSWAWERWQGSYDWAGASLHRVGAGQHRWHLDQLVVVRDDERVRCGYVTRVALEPSGDLALTVKLWAGSPSATAVRALTTMLVEEAPFPTVMLGVTPDEKASLIVPARTFSAGRVLRSLASGPERRFRLSRLVQRGADFERVAFEETAP
jgi:hypothetical protein